MKRWVRRIVLCLFLGAVINVAVAWGLASRIPTGGGFWWVTANPLDHVVFMEGDGDGETIAGPVESRFGVTVAYLHFWPRGLRGREWYKTAPMPDRWVREAIREYGSELDGYLFFASGFPARALWCDWADNWNVRGGIELKDGVEQSGALPLRPIMFGMVINTLFYAVIAWALFFFAPSQIRRTHRRRRGRCPSCGYDLQHALDTGCPECGWGRGAGVESCRGGCVE